MVKGLEAYGWTEDVDLLAADITEKTPDEVDAYYEVFKQKWKTLPGMFDTRLNVSAFVDAWILSEYPRIQERITEGEAKRNKRSNLEHLLSKKIASVRYPMQELELNYPTTKGKVYSEEEDRYLLCRLNHYGMTADDIYERIKRDISEFPVFRFDWFFKSRSPQELQRRCTTLLGMIEKEADVPMTTEPKPKVPGRGKKRGIEEIKEEDQNISRASTPNGSTASLNKKASKKKLKA